MGKALLERVYFWRDCSCGYGHAGAGIALKALRPMQKATLQQAHLKATVALDKSMLQQVCPWRGCGSRVRLHLEQVQPLKDYSLWVSPSQSRGKERSSLQC